MSRLAPSGKPHMPGVAVFCGARAGSDPAYGREAVRLGRELAARNLRLVFGGGSTGLMGALAETVQLAGGPLAGIVPKDIFVKDVTEGADFLFTTESLRERKSLMRANADVLVALAGGIGTLDEIIDALAERQLGGHRKEIILVNTLDCWMPLLGVLDAFVSSGFAAPRDRDLISVVADAEEAVDRIDRVLGTGAT